MVYCELNSSLAAFEKLIQFENLNEFNLTTELHWLDCKLYKHIHFLTLE